MKKLTNTNRLDRLARFHDTSSGCRHAQQPATRHGAVSAITKKHNAVSFHVFAFGGDGHTAHVRDFAPLYDIPEESATGTANAALTHYLSVNGVIPAKGDFSFLQGEAMGRPSIIMTRIAENGTIYVGGSAYILAKGEIFV